MRREIDRLLKQADRDLDNARKNLTIQAYEVAAFLAQQAVEKYLKGAWVVTKKEPAPDYTVSRYPDAANAVPYELYDEPTALAKVEAAEEITKWIESLIRS